MSEKKIGEQRMSPIEIIKVAHTVVEDKSCDTSANRKKQAAWEKISKEMSANFPERPKSSAKNLREIDLHKTGGGAAIMAIIAEDLEQIHNDVDDGAVPMFEGLAQTQTDIHNVTASSSTADSLERANQEYSENISSAEEHEELEHGDALHVTQNTQTSKPTLLSTGRKKTFSTATRHESNRYCRRRLKYCLT